MIETLSILQTSFLHMTKVPGFWLLIGFTIAISMFVGALIYGGQLSGVKNGLFGVLSFATMLIWISVSQVIDARIRRPELLSPDIKAVSYVLVLNVATVTVAWLIGVLLGVIIIKVKHKNKLYRI